MEKRINYDFTKCNNLEFKGDIDGRLINGYLKITGTSEVYIFFFGDESSYDVALQVDFANHRLIFTNINSFSKWAERVNLEIVPRDSETYNDWKVGDVIECKNDKIEPRIITAKLGEVIFTSDMLGKYVYAMSLKNITESYKLVLTDYEQELLKEQEQKKYSFKKGDRVIVRDFNSNKWGFAIFELYNNELYYVQSSGPSPLPYRQCIPFNKHTWQLLGTTDEYKEE